MKDRTTQGALPAALQNSGIHSGNGSTKGNDLPSIDPPPKRHFPDFIDPHRRTPVLLETAARALSLSPRVFNDVTICGVIHLEDNALPFIDAILRLGADARRITLFAKNADGYRYQNRREVIRTLQKWKVTVLSTQDVTAQRFEAIADAAVQRNEKLLFIEDGPFFGEHLLQRPDLWPLVNVVQQTTRGMPPYLNANEPFRFPVASLPDSELKRMKEALFIGKTFMRALSVLFPHREWANEKITIFGSGAVGRAIGDAASNNCMRVTFVDVSYRSQFLADNICGDIRTPIEAVRDAGIIVGVTGGPTGPSITADVLAAAPHGAIIIANGSERFEIEYRHLEAIGKPRPLYIDGVRRSPKTRIGTTYTIGPRSKELHLINGGWPCSFIGVPGTTCPDQVIDYVLAMMLSASVELASGRFAGVGGIIPGVIDKLADEWGIPAAYLRYWRI